MPLDLGANLMEDPGLFLSNVATTPFDLEAHLLNPLGDGGLVTAYQVMSLVRTRNKSVRFSAMAELNKRQRTSVEKNTQICTLELEWLDLAAKPPVGSER